MSKVWGWVKHPAFFAVFYLMAIPAFALWYDDHGCDFYQSTAVQEPSYKRGLQSLNGALPAAIAACIDREGQIESPGSRPPEITTISDVTGSPDAVTVEGTIKIGASPFNTFHMSLQPRDVDLTLSGHLGPDGGDDSGKMPVTVPFSLITSNTTEAAGKAFDLFAKCVKSPPGIQLSSHDYRTLKAVVAAQEGYVGALPDQYLRMLYFSAVTETTLGFGDITPINTLTRSVVTGQAVLGVVVIGLFLNALSRRTAQGTGTGTGTGTQGH
jgi:hypothetical protein